MRRFILALIVSFLILPFAFALTQNNLTYDANGNLIAGDGFYRTYNSLNQPWRVYNGSNGSGTLLQEYVYHPSENRVLVKRNYFSNGSLRESVYYINKNLVRVINSSGTYDTVLVYADGQQIAQVNPDNTTEFISTDHLGSASIVTAANGSVIERTTYAPFGQILSGGVETRFDYTNKEFDSAIGDYDFNARRYNPTNAQFIMPDPLIQNLFDPQILSSYAYVRNNPYKFIDPDGREVRLQTRDVLNTFGVGDHTYLLISPDHPEDFGQSVPFSYTYGGQPDSNSKFYFEKDNAQDISDWHVKQIDMVEPPVGMTDTEFIKKINEGIETYNGLISFAKPNFAPLASGSNAQNGVSANCNVGSTSALEYAGVDISNINPPGIHTGLGDMSPTISRNHQATSSFSSGGVQLQSRTLISNGRQITLNVDKGFAALAAKAGVRLK